ncbi:MAG: recombinase family protein, partial [Bacillota bacterium]|nr:recombinase family protein [Bacillota bacterium]
MAGEKAALYLRLSREDDDNKSGNSESIKNQRDFLIKFANENNLEVSDIYADDGFSGTSFDRPEFNRMLKDIEAGKINTVLAKDLSRLGRDYIMTGHYIEIYFPSKNVRFIAVNDGIDTFSDTETGDMTPFRAVFNDMYAKDISGKVRTALMTKKKNGAFIGSVAPYGYKKSPENKNKLVIDDITAQHVRQIYRMFLGGRSVSEIALTLTEQRIETPSESKGLNATQKRFPGVWNANMVKYILKNPTYAGHLTQNRMKKISYKIKKKVSLPESRWITVLNTHKPIISQADFDTAQLRLKIRSYNSVKRGKTHLLTGLVFCGDCKAPMSTIRESENRTYLVCQTWRKYAGLKLCTSHCIREDDVINETAKELRELAESRIDRKQLAEDIASELQKIGRTDKTAPAIRKNL